MERCSRLWLVPVSVCALIIGFTGLSFAQDEADTESVDQESGYVAEIVDVNSDGTIDDRERRIWRKNRLKRADRNGDGVIDPKEKKRYKAWRDDLNKDGKIDLKEKILDHRRRDWEEDTIDRKEDIVDRREDVLDRREDRRDRGPGAGPKYRKGNPPGPKGGPGAGPKYRKDKRGPRGKKGAPRGQRGAKNKPARGGARKGGGRRR